MSYLKKSALFLLSAALTGIVVYAFFHDYDHSNEWLFHNGTILTMKDSSSQCEALLVLNGKIQATGSLDSLKRLSSKNVRLFDLQGQTLMPGFIDPHGHLDLAASYYNMMDVSGFTYKTSEEVWSALRKKVASSPENEWIYCHGLDPILTKGLASPTLAFLDSIAPKNPLVIITQAVHTFYANSLAFSLLNIDSRTKNPSASSYYGRNSDGTLNGQIIEQAAFAPFRSQIQTDLKRSFVAHIPDQMRLNAQKGITSTVTMGALTPSSSLLLYKHLSSNQPTFIGNLLGLVGVFPTRQALPRHFVYLRAEDAKYLPPKRKAGNDFFKVMGLKYWYDGSPYSGSMYLEAPYTPSHFISKDLGLGSHHHGKGLYSPASFAAAIQQPLQDGWNIAIHTQGDRALTEIMDVLESQHKKQPFQSLVRLEHCMFFPGKEMKKAAELGISASFHVNHILYYGDFLEGQVIGVDRASQIFPIRSFQETGQPFSLHADQPMFEADPLSLAKTAVLRTTESGRQLNPNESISVWEALKSVTVYAADQLGMLPVLGTLESGKYADLILLDQNPMQVPPERLSDIRVKRAWVAGIPLW